MSDDRSTAETFSTAEKLAALRNVATYRPGRTALIVVLSIGTTVLEGVGIGFLLPIIEFARTGGDVASEGSALLMGFVRAYEFIGIPFTLETLIAGVALVMSVRVAVGFFVTWLSLRLKHHYVRDLQTAAFERTLAARLGYLDGHGSDELLNELVTRVYYAEAIVGGFLGLVQQGLLVAMYFAVAFYLSPTLAAVTTALFVVLAVTVRLLSGPAEVLGDRVATAHERVQSTAQAGVQGARDAKLFGIQPELGERFRADVDSYTDSTVALGRNQAAIESAYHLLATLMVFAVLYLALDGAVFTLGELGVFTFVVYRLAPQLNGLNGLLYQLDGSLPHTARTHRFVAALDSNEEPTAPVAAEPVPDRVGRVAFDCVSFAYDDDPVVRDVSLSVAAGELVALTGPSGAGKSTLAALLARLYEPNEGQILADDTPIDRFDVTEWRSRVAVVPQDPHLFDETLRYNLTVGAREASDAALERACEAAQVTEFVDDLTDGYDTELGDDGVRLSGGQRQRVAVARALLLDADVLVFDEATSDLDADLERRVYAAIESLDRTYATLVITHQLAAVTDADRIYTIEDGRVTEVGDHRTLLANGGTYAELFAARGP